MEQQAVDQVEDFQALAVHWERLAAIGGVRTPFQSFAWLEQWLRYRGTGIEPVVLVIQEGDTIAPLGISSRRGLRRLSLLGAPDSDYGDLVTTRPIDEAWEGVARALADRRRSFDIVHLQSVRDQVPITAALRRHLHGEGRQRLYERCPWISTSRSWEDLRSRRGTGFRSELKRWERRIRERGEIEVERLKPPLADELVDELETVERESWKWNQGDSAFRNGSQRQFIRALLQDARADVVVWLLRVATRVVAYAVVLMGPDRWYYYLPSFRKEVPNAGALLLAQIVEAACVGGCPVVDLLRGDHGYKRTWSDGADTVYEIVWPSSVLGRVASLGYAARWRAAESRYLSELRDRLRGSGDRRPEAPTRWPHRRFIG